MRIKDEEQQCNHCALTRHQTEGRKRSLCKQRGQGQGEKMGTQSDGGTRQAKDCLSEGAEYKAEGTAVFLQGMMAGSRGAKKKTSNAASKGCLCDGTEPEVSICDMCWRALRRAKTRLGTLERTVERYRSSQVHLHKPYPVQEQKDGERCDIRFRRRFRLRQ